MSGIDYPRRPFDAPGDFFHITPLMPVLELRKEALAAHPPAETGAFRKPDLVQLNQNRPHNQARYPLRHRPQLHGRAALPPAPRIHAAPGR